MVIPAAKHMNRKELDALHVWLSQEVEHRRKLGLYSQEAGAILNLFEVVLKISKHLKPDKAKKK